MITSLVVRLQTSVLATQIPDGEPALPAGVGDFFSQLIGWAKGAVLALGVLGMIACGAMMIVGRRNRSSIAVEGAAGIPWVLGGIFLASTAATLVGAVVS